MRLSTHEQDTALYVAAFFDELTRWGVCDVVVSPGSRSTALAMAAFELSCRRPDDLRVFMDIDERGASFFALGCAKASGRPVALVCTSGTAAANYYPAVIEAETSRVPLIVLSGDRPPQLQGLGAPQTTDQLKLFGNHVRSFRAMPLPGSAPKDIAFVRQAAREAVIAAMGLGAVLPPAQSTAGSDAAPKPDIQVASRACSLMAGPVQLNFPFDIPLKPDFPGADAQAQTREGCDCFAMGRPDRVRTPQALANQQACGPLVGPSHELDPHAAERVEKLLASGTVLVLAGEGTCSTYEEACEVVAWARRAGFPLLADPLSGLRCVNDPLVIDNYDNFADQSEEFAPDLVIRFGRFPVSKGTGIFLDRVRPLNVVVDAGETRDFNAATDVFVSTTPLGFVRSPWVLSPAVGQQRFAQLWIERNNASRRSILQVEELSSETPAETAFAADQIEGAYLRALLSLIPEGSCLFSANSMSIRALDTFMVKGGHPVALLGNRGQNGIDGVVSTALGVSWQFGQTTFLTGDFTMMHDLNALALQREYTERAKRGQAVPSVVIVLLNNNGGAIFDLLPQASDEPYFERLFLAPQDVNFLAAAEAFNVPAASVSTVDDFRQAYTAALGRPGISLVEIALPLRGVRDRYAPFQQ